MSVLINGVEMPTSCYECPCNKDDGFGFFTCGVTKSECDFRNLPSDCPLISVPPHGRLIDADALSKSLDALCDRVCQYSKAQRKVMCSACPLGDAFAVVEDDAPTVIEAEEDDTWD